MLIHKSRREVVTLEGQMQWFQRNVEDWFNQATDRFSGWYKRWTQKVLLFLAFSVVIIANADTVMIVQRLNIDSALRASLVVAAEDAAKLPPATTRNATILAKAERLDLPLGWSTGKDDPQHVPWVMKNKTEWPKYYFSKIVGLLISGFAVSLGAPFWFDTLNKFMNLRGTGVRPDDAKKSEPHPQTR